MTVNRYGNCQLCGEVIESGLIVEPFGNCCDNCVQDVKEFGTSRILTDEGTK